MILTFSKKEEDSWKIRMDKSMEIGKQRLDKGNSKLFLF